jgi:hypothetical protein
MRIHQMVRCRFVNHLGGRMVYEMLRGGPPASAAAIGKILRCRDYPGAEVSFSDLISSRWGFTRSTRARARSCFNPIEYSAVLPDGDLRRPVVGGTHAQQMEGIISCSRLPPIARRRRVFVRRIRALACAIASATRPSRSLLRSRNPQPERETWRAGANQGSSSAGTQPSLAEDAL